MKKKLRIWLVKLEESGPFHDPHRTTRMDMLAQNLSDRGHIVTRWASTYSHKAREYIFKDDRFNLNVNGVSYNFMHTSLKYKSSSSLMRLLNNEILGIKFYLLGRRSKDRPDIIICSVPAISLAFFSALLSKLNKTILILDARDYWPDIFDVEIQGIKRIFLYPVMWWMSSQLKYAAKSATSLVGITPFFRDHLINYANRKLTIFDAHFPLGFKKLSKNLMNAEVSKVYWKNQGINFDKKIIYFAGTINRTIVNTMPIIAETALRLAKEKKQVEFVFCGSGGQLPTVKRTYKDFPNITFVGHVSSFFLTYLASRSYLAILPVENRIDYHNSLPNKFFDYLSNSLPILSRLDGYLGDIITKEKCGKIFDSGESLYQCIEEYVKDEKMRDEESKYAFQLFNREFTDKVVYEKFSKHIEKVFDMKTS